MLLIGSRSLATYIKLDRAPADWDIIVSRPEFDHMLYQFGDKLIRKSEYKYGMPYKGTNVEIEIAEDGGSSFELFLLSHRISNNDLDIIDTPLGKAYNASLAMHLVLKQSSLPLGKVKHAKDLEELKKYDIFVTPELQKILIMRTQETYDRIEKSKFFNRYKITRYVEHDTIHKWIAQALSRPVPAYTKILENTFKGGKDKFMSLSYVEQKACIVEEAIALTIERSYMRFISKRSDAPMNAWNRYIRATHKSSDPFIRWLDRILSTGPGRLKDNPLYISKWGILRYNDLVNTLKHDLKEIEFNMPNEFWTLVKDVYEGRAIPLKDET